MHINIITLIIGEDMTKLQELIQNLQKGKFEGIKEKFRIFSDFPYFKIFILAGFIGFLALISLIFSRKTN